MRRFIPLVAVLFLTFNTSANAATISFPTDPFAGSTSLITPGHRFVGGEPFIRFNIATDVSAIDPIASGIDQILFADDLAGTLPTSDVDVEVLQALDNDSDPLTPFEVGDLSDNTADQPDVHPVFTEENFAVTQPPARATPRLPATLLLMTTGVALLASRRLRGKRTRV